MNRIILPENLVQYVAQDLLRRAQVIQLDQPTVHEISPAPLPREVLRAAYPKSEIAQWHVQHGSDATHKANWLEKINPFSNGRAVKSIPSSVFANEIHTAKKAQLVFAPFIADGVYGDELLTGLEHIHQWFSDDGVLLFAALGAGTLPELVNAQPEWLAQVQNLPNIMEMGRRLQDLQLGFPVLDVEKVRLGYDDAAVLWQDILNISPSLQRLSANEQSGWQHSLTQFFDSGAHEFTFEIIYGQVWQTQAELQKAEANGFQTVSLESLKASLPKTSSEPSSE